MAMAYTRIPLETLDMARATLRRHLKEREAATGHKYDIRTFYLGPRRGFDGRQGTTNKADAYAAKIAIYDSKDGDRFYSLAYYV